jgi:hypothetical protein
MQLRGNSNAVGVVGVVQGVDTAEAPAVAAAGAAAELKCAGNKLKQKGWASQCLL